MVIVSSKPAFQIQANILHF